MEVHRVAYLEAYQQEIVFTPFLSTFFVTKPSYIRNSKTVKIDIKRNEKYVAPVISSAYGRAGKIQKKDYAGKEFEPPTVALGSAFDASEYEGKVFGIDEYKSAEVEYIFALQNDMMEVMLEIEARMGRAVEWQASQIFNHANEDIILYDENDEAVFIINYKGKAAHFPDVTTSWSDENSNPDGDIQNLSKIIQRNGHSSVRNLVFGENALINYLKNTKIQDKFDIRRIVSGSFDPREENEDVTYLGNLLVGSRRYDCWEYSGEFIHPETGDPTPYVDPDKVLFLPAMGSRNVDFRLVYCRVFSITKNDPRFTSLIPTGFVNLGNRAFTSRIWTDEGADNLNIEIKTKPLCIPVSIDTFGALNTIAPSP
jgi:hypothetical protein